VGGDAWLSIVIGASGVIAIILIAVVVRSIRPGPGPGATGGSGGSGSTSSFTRNPRRTGLDLGPTTVHRRASARGWEFRSFGPWHQHRSVEHRMQRAFERVDAIDPYAMPRRIGNALAETGLLSEGSDEPARQQSPTSWPFGQARGRQQRKDEE
jgi:hypothetical protein